MFCSQFDTSITSIPWTKRLIATKLDMVVAYDKAYYIDHMTLLSLGYVRSRDR